MTLLDAVEALPVDSRALSEGLLCEFRVEACGPDAVADSSPCGEDAGRRWGRRHPLNGRRTKIFCLYRGPYIYGSRVEGS